MIGMLEGREANGKEFIVALFGKWEDCENVIFSYIWRMYHPVTDSDFRNLPELIEIAFRDLDSEKEMTHLCWRETTGKGKEEKEKDTIFFDHHKINIINTKIDSEMIRIITGEEPRQEGIA